MTPPRVSVVVVSRHRPDALRLCLTGLAQLDYPAFEIVVICDPASRAEVRDPAIKVEVFDEANISAARNRGIALAGGEVVAFIDDDAVPEPTWLSHLVAPFARPDVQAAGGYVRGRNGIGFQWRGRLAFPDGRTEPLPLSGDAPAILQGRPGQAIKTEGTNMAVRRETLVALGGFDPAFRFYLDETDLNMRLAGKGAFTAIVPRAQVHHGYAASDRRDAHRVPRDLFDLGASAAAFARKHGGSGGVETARFADRRAQRVRLLRLMRDGRLMPGDVRRLMGRFDAGWTEGLSRQIGEAVEIGPAPVFRPYPGRFTGHETISARFWQAASARRKARARVAEGTRITLILLSFTALYHRVRFTEDGVWEQRGGQFGRADRDQPLFRFRRARQRIAEEIGRTAGIRTEKS